MEVAKMKNNAKKTLAELVGTGINHFSDVVKKVMEIKGMDIKTLAHTMSMDDKAVINLRDKSRKPLFITIVRAALGLELQHEDFYWFLQQGNVALSDFRLYDRYIKENVDRGYRHADAVSLCTVSENDPWLFQKAA